MQRLTKITYILLVFVLFTSCKENTNNTTADEPFQEVGIPAIDALTKELFKDKTNPEILYKRSKEYANIEAYDNAISDMYVAMKIDSLQPKYYVHLSDVFMKYYRSSQAFSTMTIAAERFPENINILLNYAELSFTLKQNQKAIQIIQQVLVQDNENAQAFFLMGLLMKEEGDTKRAKAAFRKVTEIDPEVIDAYILLGELYEKDDPKLALQYLNNALVVHPEDINALHSKAYFFQNNNRIDDALEIYKQINIINSDYSPAFLNAGILFLEKEDADRALEQFHILTKINPANHLGYYFRGLAYKLKGELDKAKQDFQQSVNLNDKDPKAQDELDKMKKE